MAFFRYLINKIALSALSAAILAQTAGRPKPMCQAKMYTPKVRTPQIPSVVTIIGYLLFPPAWMAEVSTKADAKNGCDNVSIASTINHCYNGGELGIESELPVIC